MTETTASALILFAVGALLLASALVSRLTRRTGLPVPLLFLGLGMLAGSEGMGGIQFDDYRLALRLGIAALALILFDGGLNTSLELVKRSYKPAVALATLGVVLTAGLTALAAYLFGLSWEEAGLIGAIVSSTDAAAVFSALRASGVQLRRRVGLTLELESGLNDPMAIILTLAATSLLAGDEGLGWQSVASVPLQLLIGAVLGVGVGRFGRLLLQKVRPSVTGLYPVLTVALALLAFAIPTLFQGSGFLAVYLAAMVLGAGPLPYRTGLLKVHDALAWFAQVGMFLLLGLLVYPSALPEVALPALGIGLALAFVARPLAVAICLLPFRFPAREVLYVGWVGLRGAVPIILATFPVLAGVRGAERIFNLVFFVVAVNSILPGATIRWVTRWLGIQSPVPPPPQTLLEITSTQPLASEVMGFAIDKASAVCGSSIQELPFPAASAAMLIVRGDELIAPRGSTTLAEGDHVYVFCRQADRPLLQLLFGREEAD